MQNGLLKNLKRPPRALAWALGLAAAAVCAVGLVYYWRVFYYLDARGVGALPLYAGALALVGLGVLAVFAGRALPDVDAKAALAVFLCGALFCFANPPLQTPDETAHFLRSYSLSLGRLDFDHDRLYPQDVAKLVESFPGAWVASHTSQGLEYTEEGEERSYTTAGYALKQRGQDGRVESIADGFAAYFDGKAPKEAVGEPYFFMIQDGLAKILDVAPDAGNDFFNHRQEKSVRSG